MEAKLRSILKQIHWSLVLKAAVFALAWWLLPFWLFFLVALYLYFVPLFQSGKLAVPLFIVLFLCWWQTPDAAFMLVFGAIFYAILLIKDLLVIDRRSAYEFLALIVAFLLLRDFYLKFASGPEGWALFSAFLAAAALAFLIRSFLYDAYDEAAMRQGMAKRFPWLLFLLLAQALIIALFLPLDFIYQSILVFLPFVLLVDLVPEYLLSGALHRNKILATSMTIFTLFVVILASAHWGI